MSSKAVVAIVGPNGYVGRNLSSAYVKAAKDGDFEEIRLLTPNTTGATLRPYSSDASGAVKVIKIDYDNIPSMESALDGVVVLISAMSGGGREDRERNLIHAAAAKGVKIYIPSEWGVDYPRMKHVLPLIEEKKAHFREAESLGLKTISMEVAYFSDMWFTSEWGVDLKTNTWTIPGDGNEPNAFTSDVDMVQYSIRAVHLALVNPSSVPSRLKVYSDLKSWNECADIFESVSGKRTKRKHLPYQELLDGFEIAVAKRDIISSLYNMFGLLSVEGIHNFPDTHNELLNPGQKYFKPLTITEYAKQVQGRH